ncbi:hypothetical protein ANAEL_02212 [Anaerolineales bacterium]|nr:hypothetical protein ANAEL_02212 [Anaerolineales bacterium]
MLKQNYRMPAILLVFVLLLACAPAIIATPLAPPTFDPSSLNTIIAQTAGAAATQTFVLQPTFTPTVTFTRTPTEAPTSTPTFLFLLATPTVPSLTPTLEISSNPFACRLVSQDPTENSVIAKNADFAVLWRVMNVGANAWDANSIDYHYLSGEKLHKQSAYDLPNPVPTGGEIDLIVNMKAPKQEGTYVTNWSLRVGKQNFCKLKVTVEVK